MEAATALLNNILRYIVNPAILLLFSLGFAVFMYGMLEFMWNLNSGEASDKGKQHMIWGVVGMFLMISAYGIIALIDETFGFGALRGNGPATDVNRANDLTSPSIFVR